MSQSPRVGPEGAPGRTPSWAAFQEHNRYVLSAAWNLIQPACGHRGGVTSASPQGCSVENGLNMERSRPCLLDMASKSGEVQGPRGGASPALAPAQMGRSVPDSFARQPLCGIQA